MLLLFPFQIVDLDTKRNRNREALNALKNHMSDSGETIYLHNSYCIASFKYSHWRNN